MQKRGGANPREDGREGEKDWGRVEGEEGGEEGGGEKRMGGRRGGIRGQRRWGNPARKGHITRSLRKGQRGDSQT